MKLGLGTTFAVAALAMTASSAAFANTYTAVTRVHAYGYVQPTSSSQISMSIPAHARVGVGPCRYGWCYISYGGRSAYIANSQLFGGGPRPDWGRAYPPSVAFGYGYGYRHGYGYGYGHGYRYGYDYDRRW